MNDPRWKEREDAIARNIMSGNNACGTLATAFQKGTLEEFLRLCVKGTLEVCASEQLDLQNDLELTRGLSEQRRALLAEIYSNVPGLPPALSERVMKLMNPAAY